MKYAKGFTLLMSVLVVSIMLGIGVGISVLITGEIYLSNIGRLSQVAYYAADAGVECAIYWDTLHNDGPYNSGSPSPFATSTVLNPALINCGPANLNSGFNVGQRNSCTNGLLGTEPFLTCTANDDKRAGRSSFNIFFENGSCAKIEVRKRNYYEPVGYNPMAPVGNPTSAAIETFIHVDGYSEGTAPNCTSSSNRVYNRSIEAIIYE